MAGAVVGEPEHLVARRNAAHPVAHRPRRRRPGRFPPRTERSPGTARASCPARILASPGLMPAALSRTTSCPGPGRGGSTSTTCEDVDSAVLVKPDCACHLQHHLSLSALDSRRPLRDIQAGNRPVLPRVRPGGWLQPVSRAAPSEPGGFLLWSPRPRISQLMGRIGKRGPPRMSILPPHSSSPRRHRRGRARRIAARPRCRPGARRHVGGHAQPGPAALRAGPVGGAPAEPELQHRLAERDDLLAGRPDQPRAEPRGGGQPGAGERPGQAGPRPGVRCRPERTLLVQLRRRLAIAKAILRRQLVSNYEGGAAGSRLGRPQRQRVQQPARPAQLPGHGRAPSADDHRDHAARPRPQADAGRAPPGRAAGERPPDHRGARRSGPGRWPG